MNHSLNKSLAAIAGILLAGHVLAADEPQKKAFNNVEEFKATIYENCNKGGLEHGEDEEYVKKVCTCAMKKLDENLTEEDYVQFMNLTLEHKDASEAPKIEQAVAKMRLCKQEVEK